MFCTQEISQYFFPFQQIGKEILGCTAEQPGFGVHAMALLA